MTLPLCQLRPDPTRSYCDQCSWVMRRLGKNYINDSCHRLGVWLGNWWAIDRWPKTWFPTACWLLCRQANDLDPDKIKLFGWVHGVIRHKAMDHHRSKARRSAALNQRAVLQEASEAQKQSDSRPAARSEQAEQVNDVVAVLESLDETKRQCLEWKYLERLSVREMAARLDVTEKAVESLLYRARLEFRERFEQQEQSYDSHASTNQSIESSARSSDQ